MAGKNPVMGKEAVAPQIRSAGGSAGDHVSPSVIDY
jgi:hypothetical protein